MSPLLSAVQKRLETAAKRRQGPKAQPIGTSRGSRHRYGVWLLSLVALITTVTIASIAPRETHTDMAIGKVGATPPTQVLAITDINGEINRAVIPGKIGQVSQSLADLARPAGGSMKTLQVKVRRGDTLSAILTQLGINDEEIKRAISAQPEGNKLYHLYPGQQLSFKLDENNGLLELVYPASDTESLHLSRSEGGFTLTKNTLALDTRIAYATGEIQSSLFVDGQNAGLSDTQIMQIADIFGWDIDFSLDLRAGDRFYVIYEEQYSQGSKIADGAVLAAEFINQGKSYRAIGYRDDKGELGYYSPDGLSLRRAFLRSPLKFSRITSRFSSGRYHPILKSWRAHKGVDYGAQTGTPIMATANGRVLFMGTKGGYGKTIILKHGGSYSTLYAHLSSFRSSVRTGSYVEQGQIIGYVGQTGMATGPHLHYEFQVDGSHRNPLTFKFPQAEPIPAENRRAFSDVSKTRLTQLERMGRSAVALNANE